MAADPTHHDQVVGQGDSVNYGPYRQMLTWISGSGSPSGAVTPEFIGQEYFDTAGEDFFRATGVTNTDWKQITA